MTAPFPPGANPFPQSQVAPSLSDRPGWGGFVGRLIIIRPEKFEQVPVKDKPGQTKERMTAAITVLDGPPVFDWYGNSGPRRFPADGSSVQIPAHYPSFWVEAAGVINTVKAMSAQGHSMVLARVGRHAEGRNGNSAAYYIDTQYTPQDLALAMANLNVAPAAAPTAAPAAPPQPVAPAPVQQAPQYVPPAPTQQVLAPAAAGPALDPNVAEQFAAFQRAMAAASASPPADRPAVSPFPATPH